MAQVFAFTQGKTDAENEDCYGSNATSFIVADGATDKSGRRYGGATGGALASRLIAEKCLETRYNGVALVSYLNEQVCLLGATFGLHSDREDARYRWSCVFTLARVVGNAVTVTSVGDVGFRINGQEGHQEIMALDRKNGQARAEYIKQTGDIAGSRAHIMPGILENFRYQNNPDDALGYGVIDGTKTPEKFVRTFVYDRVAVKTIELFSDGYFSLSEEPTIASWEEMHARVEKEDPDKYLRYLSTKSRDDRTVLIVALP